MYIPKKYGQSQTNSCPFCSLHATTTNSSGVPVCIRHKKSQLPQYKCVCGNQLVQMKGKFGIFFNCSSCGNFSMKKALDINGIKK